MYIDRLRTTMETDEYRDRLSTIRETVMSKGIVRVHHRDCVEYRDSLSTSRETEMSVGIV